jgi:hypothetical protein
MTRREALAELFQFSQDPNRQKLLEKFKQCPESRQASELLGQAVLNRKGYSRHNRHADSLPVPPSVVHPG